jgi:hypothetical protein
LACVTDITHAIFIGLAIAIIVFLVALFGGGGDFSLAVAPDAGGAGFATLFTESFSGCPCAAAVARLGEAVVRLAVTVVIFVVAGFGFWSDFACAVAPKAALASLYTCLADAFSGSAGGAAVAAFGQGFAAAFGVVDSPVAIVVFAIAGFYGGDDLIEADRPFARRLAGAFSRTTRTLAEGAGRSAVASFGISDVTLAFFAIGEIVFFAVAVVVFAIANLGIGRDCVAAFPLACLAIFLSRVAASRTGSLEVVVDGAVAVIISVVALLNGGQYLACAVEPFSVCRTGLGSAFAGALSFCALRTAVAFADGVGRALAIFVNCTVTVIVFVVAACFFCGLWRVAGFVGSCLADFFTYPAFVLAFFADAIVDESVAVVVFVVADFGLWQDLVEAGAPNPVSTSLYAVFAESFVLRRGRPCVTGLGVAIFAITAIVYGAVAVIVFAVTVFFGWLDFFLAWIPGAVVANLKALFAKPLIGCAFRPIVATALLA